MDYFDFLREDGIINSETMLQFALYCMNYDMDFEDTLAHDIVVSYVMHEFEKKDQDYTIEEVFERCEELAMGHMNAKMVEDGFLEPDFSGEEITYELTESGKIRLDFEKAAIEDGKDDTEDSSSSEDE